MAYSGTAYISYSVTSSSITCKLMGLGTYEWAACQDSSAKVLWLLYDASGNGAGMNDGDTYSAYATSSQGVTFTGLIAGATYTLMAVIYTSTSSQYASLDEVSVTLSSSSGGGTVDFTPTVSIASLSSTDTSVTLLVYQLATATGCAPKFIQVFVNGSAVQTTTLDNDSATNTLVTVSGLSANTTYQVYCVVSYLGMYGVTSNYSATSPIISVTTNSTSTTRPTLFAWTNPKVKGEAFNLTADEWTALCANVSQVLAYKGQTSSSFTAAIKGQSFTAIHYNEVVTAIQRMGGGASLTSVQSGNDIAADLLNGLVTALNAIS